VSFFVPILGLQSFPRECEDKHMAAMLVPELTSTKMAAMTSLSNEELLFEKFDVFTKIKLFTTVAGRLC
jgi:hypothetical protein